MTDIYVSDLYGYEINSKTKFLVISGPHIHKFLRRIAKNKTMTIYEYDMIALGEILKNRNIDVSNYSPLGNTIYTKGIEPDKLILAHMSISVKPTALKEVATFDGGKIMKPIWAPQNPTTTIPTAIGSIYVKNGSSHKNHLTKIAMIPTSLTLIQNKKAQSFSSTNDFFLIQSPNEPIKTIAPVKTNNPHTMKLMSSNSKYLTLVDGKDAKLMSPLYSSAQLVSYNAQGALVINDKCLTRNDSSSPTSFKSCDPSSIKQKWSIYDGKIAALNTQQCLTQKQDDIILEQCKDMDEQTWDEEAEDTENSSDFSWDFFKGRNVVLVESDNPWFINKNDTFVQKYIKPNVPDASLLEYRANADVNFEQFNTTPPAPQDNTSRMIFLLCIIVILLTLYRWNK